MEPKKELESRTITIKKIFNAPVKVVWEAWTQTEHIVKWWGPNGMDVKVIEHDFKVGGKWKYTMAMPDGNQFISEGVYSAIEKFKRIATSANFKPMTEGVELQVLFEENNGQTHFTFSVIHPTVEYCKQQEKMGIYNGWGSVFKRLETLVNNWENS